MKKITLVIIAFIGIATVGCIKEPVEKASTSTASNDLNKEVLAAFSNNVAQSTYNDLAKAWLMEERII
jgi:hypothetical protein